MEIDLGIMTTEQAERVSAALDGQTYMKFRVDLGTVPGPATHVWVSTDYEAPAAQAIEIYEFAMSALATSPTACVAVEKINAELLRACQLYVQLDDSRRAGCELEDGDWAECHQAAMTAIAKAKGRVSDGDFIWWA